MGGNQPLRETRKVGLVHGADFEVSAQSVQRDEVGFQFSPDGGCPIFSSDAEVLVECEVFLATALMKGDACQAARRL